MAVYWNLGLFARERADAEACAAYFRAQRLEYDGTIVELEITETEVPGGSLVGVWPRGMNYGSPQGRVAGLVEEPAREAIAATFDRWLRAAPPFTVAFFGAEAYDYLLDGIGEIDEPFGGLVFDETMFVAFGRPASAQRLGPSRYTVPRTSIP